MISAPDRKVGSCVPTFVKMGASKSLILLCLIVLSFYAFALCLAIPSDFQCSVGSTCIPTQFCEFQGVRSLKWCDDKKSKVCCPKSVHYDPPKDAIYKESSYSDSKQKVASPSYIPSDDNYRRDTKDEYRDIYRDYYEDSYLGYSLSNEAKKILRNYDGKECGVRRSFSGRISTGHEVELGVTKYGEFPWQVAVLLREEKSGYGEAYKYICGGTVINPKLVLTAAHCIKGIRLNNLKLKLGEWNLKGSQGEIFPSIERKIERAIIHDYYNSATFAHNIAILVLNKPIDFRKTPHVSQICLPPKIKFDEYTKCYIVGWGNDIYKPNYGSNILKVASVSLLKQDCRHKLKESIPSLSNNFLREEVSCISGSFGKDACVGDGGGAVVCPLKNSEVPVCRKGYSCEEEHYFIAGVISWGSDRCGQDDSVTVITEIHAHFDWILDKTRKYGGSRATYDNPSVYGSNIYDKSEYPRGGNGNHYYNDNHREDVYGDPIYGEPIYDGTYN